MRARGKQELFLGDALGKNLIRLTDDAEEPGRSAMVTGQQAYCLQRPIVWNRADDMVEVDVAVMNVDTQAVKHLTDDGRSQFAFWHDPTLAVEAVGKILTSWGTIKGQVIDANK